MSSNLTEYRRRVLSRFQSEFAFHAEVATTIEGALLTVREQHPLTRLVLDMLLVQAQKSHAAVSLLAQHGLMEDTATLTRRLLEVSVQAVYIGAEGNAKLRERKAGQYIAFMWRQLPRRARARLPEDVRRQWGSIARRYGRFVRARAKTWCPNWRELFTEIGAANLYTSDYSFLSGIAHGRSDHQIFQFSQTPIRIHNDEFAGVLLLYSSRYHLAAANEWNRHFGILPEAVLRSLTERAFNWKFGASAA